MSEHNCSWDGPCGEPDHCMTRCQEKTADLEAKLREAERKLTVQVNAYKAIAAEFDELKADAETIAKGHAMGPEIRDALEYWACDELRGMITTLERWGAEEEAKVAAAVEALNKISSSACPTPWEVARYAMVSLGQVPERVRAQREVIEDAVVNALMDWMGKRGELATVKSDACAVIREALDRLGKVEDGNVRL